MCWAKGCKFGATWGDVLGCFSLPWVFGKQLLWLGRRPGQARMVLALNTVSRGTYMPSPPLISCHLENWDGAQPAVLQPSRQTRFLLLCL